MGSRSLSLGVLACLLGCTRAPVTDPRPDATPLSARYTVAILDDFRGANVRVCLEGGTIRELVPMRIDDAKRLESARIGDALVPHDRGRIPVRATSSAPCVEYSTQFDGAAIAADDAPAVVLSQAQWLWRPEPFPLGLEATVRFVLPPGQRVSAPWPQVDDGAYSLSESAFFTDAYVVFGSFDEQSLAVAGATLDVVRLGPRPSRTAVKRWLGRAARAAASVGPFPRDRVHFVITPTDIPEDDVVFGMLRRGGGASILLVPSANATDLGLDTDWVAVHELSHLWLPKFYPQDRWLSEGIATYLQEVLRARCGMQDAATAWRRLLEGFDRGRRSGTGRRLTDESRDMDRTGAYHRVYWAGAAFALEADVWLREASGGERTLLSALSRAQQIWGQSARPYARSTFVRALDGSGELNELSGEYQARSEFPDTSFVDAIEGSALGADIMGRAEEPCDISVESRR